MLIRPGRVGAISRTRRGPLYDPYYEQLLVAMGTAPPADVRGYQNELIIGLRTDQVWSLLDGLRIWATDTADNQLYNWLNPTANKATLVNSPTFTAYRGMNGDGVSSWANTNWAPSNGVNFQQDSNSLFAYVLTDVQGNAVFGTNTGGNLLLQPRNASNLFGYRVNQASSTTVANTDGSGFYAAERSGVNATQGYKDGAAIGSAGAVASTARSTQTMSVGRVNTTYSSAQVAASGVGAYLGPTKQLALRNRIRTYLQRVGAVA